MNNTFIKILLVGISFLILTLVFFLTEKREDNLKEEIFWKINPDKIIYYPPSQEYQEKFPKFMKAKITFQKHPIALKVPPFFSVKTEAGKDNSSIVYEGGFNTKNLFTELSVFRIQSIHIIEDEVLEKFELSLENSPRVEIYKNDKLEKTILIGQTKRNLRFLVADNFILSAHAHIFNKFQGDISKFRERRLILLGQSYMENVIYKTETDTLNVVNEPKQNKQTQGNVWFKQKNGNKIKIDPQLGNEMLRYLKSLNIALFPDEKEGQGFEIAKILIDTHVNQEIIIKTSYDIQYNIEFHPPVDIHDKRYIPTHRNVNDMIQESPIYLREEDVNKITNSFESIKTAKEYKEPKKKTDTQNK